MFLSKVLRWVRRRTTTAAAAALTLVWAWTAIGVNVLWIATTMAVLVLAVIWLRRNRDVRWSLLLAGSSTMVFAGWAIAVMGTPTTAAQELAAAVTGCAIAAPVPTLTAWLWQPRLIRPLPPALFGTAAVGATAAISALTGTTRWVPAALLGQMVVGAAVGLMRQRSAGSRLIDGLDRTDFGWHERRAGKSKVLYRCGAVIVVIPCGTTQPGQATRRRAVITAVRVAASVRLPPSRIQPVLTNPKAIGIRRIPTTVGALSAQVVVAHPDKIADVAATATVYRCSRRPLLRIARMAIQFAQTEVASRA